MDDEAKQLQIQPKEHLQEWTDLWFSKHKKAGYIAITDFEQQFFYGTNDIKKVKGITAGRKRQYISINSFNVDWNNKKFSRKTENLKQIRNIAIDIDQYKLGLTIEETLDNIQSLILENKIPEPNLVLVSRGIQIFYSINRGASPKMAWLASYITEQLISKLDHIGADSNAKDMSRVMRVPYSINERNNAFVMPYIWDNEAYTLQELQCYCKPLDKFETKNKIKNNLVNLPVNAKISQYYRTNHARLRDLRKLIELRNGNFTNMRNTFLYIYTYHQSLILDTQEDVIKSVSKTFEGIHSTANNPTSNKEFNATVQSAYNNAKQFFKHYTQNGHDVTYNSNAHDGIYRPYKTKTIIKLLNITEKEQYHLGSIRNKEIKKLQDKERKEQERRNAGMKTMEEYNNSRKQKTEQLRNKIIELKNQGMKHKEIADMMAISSSRVSQLTKKV